MCLTYKTMIWCDQILRLLLLRHMFVLQHLSKRGVQEISLKFDPPCNQLPACLLMCKSLLSLRLHCSWFPSTSNINICFTGLLDLTLSNTIISERDLKSVLISCQALQSLSLVDLPFNNPVGVREIEICSGSLKSLVVTDSPIRNICIEHAPNMERLLLGTGLPVGTCVKVVHAPKIEVLGFLEMGYNKFEVGGTRLKVVAWIVYLSDSIILYGVHFVLVVYYVSGKRS